MGRGFRVWLVQSVSEGLGQSVCVCVCVFVCVCVCVCVCDKIFTKEDAGLYDCLRYAVRGYGVGVGLRVWLVQSVTSVSEGLGQ